MPPAARQKRPVTDSTFLNFQLCYVSDGASETATPERAAVNAGSYPLWPFLPFQPATMSLVACGIPPQRKIPPAFVDFKCPLCYTWKHAAVLESVDKADLKSAGRNSVRVRVPSAAPLRNDLWMSDDRASAFISTAKVFLRSKSQSLTLDCDFVLQICQLIHSVHIAQLRNAPFGMSPRLAARSFSRTGRFFAHIAPPPPAKSDYAPPVISASTLIVAAIQEVQ